MYACMQSLKRCIQSKNASNAYRPRNTASSRVILDLCLSKTWSEKKTWLSRLYRFWKSSTFNFFRPHESSKSTFWNSSLLKNVFEKVHFRDGLVWTMGLTLEIKVRFQITQASYYDLYLKKYQVHVPSTDHFIVACNEGPQSFFEWVQWCHRFIHLWCF